MILLTYKYPQNHGITDWKGPQKLIESKPLSSRVRYSRLLVHLGFEYLHGWRFYTSLGKPLQCLTILKIRKNFFILFFNGNII